MNKSSQAFTLVEMAIVMIIIAFLLSRFLIPLSTQIDQQRIQVTEQRLQEIKEALIGYAIINRHLPCPAAELDGRAEPYNLSVASTPTVCDNGTNDTDAYLPWADLGVSQYDGWNRPFRYRVDGGFSDALQYFSNTVGIKEPAFDYLPLTEHFLRIQNLAGQSLIDEFGASYRAPAPRPNESLPRFSPRNQYESHGLYGSLGSEVVAIVFSCGKNGKPDGRRDPNNPNNYLTDSNFPESDYGSMKKYNKMEYFSNDADGQVNSDAQCTNFYPFADSNNTVTLDRKTNYIQDAYVEGNFDDLLVWLPRNLVIQRMIAAGVWSADLQRYALQVPSDLIFSIPSDPATATRVATAATEFKTYLSTLLSINFTKRVISQPTQKYHQVYTSDPIDLDKFNKIQGILLKNQQKIEDQIEEIFNVNSLPLPSLPLQNISRVLYF